jgi:subtilisin-like proprotein convertase family protein
MNIFKLSFIGLFCFVGIAHAATPASPKTTTPERVPATSIAKEPYRFNGAVTTDEGRGSGFCAWNKRAFFSAAHVVIDEEKQEWSLPPVWTGRANSLRLDPKKGIRSRGYYRWSDYAEIVEADGGVAGEAFSRDVIVGFAFKDLIAGSPAKINLNAVSDLRAPVRTLMTGYPARVAYNDKPTKGYFMHKTGPVVNTYKRYSGMALETTLVSSGPGNSGGPLWTPAPKSSWAASGVVVGGLPSETIIYAFSKETNYLLRAVEPVLTPGVPQSVDLRGTEASSRFFSSARARELPDGIHQWTDYSFNVDGFELDATVLSVKVSVKVKTSHRGDLQIILSGPGGYEAIVHNEQGGAKRNLLIQSKNVSEPFLDIPAEGRWSVRFQDRLKGDICTVQSVTLEIEAEAGKADAAPEP